MRVHCRGCGRRGAALCLACAMTVNFVAGVPKVGWPHPRWHVVGFEQHEPDALEPDSPVPWPPMERTVADYVLGVTTSSPGHGYSIDPPLDLNKPG